MLLQAGELKWGLCVNKWSDVKCSDVGWTDVIYVKWFYFEVKWSGVKCSDVEWNDVIYVKWFCFEVKWSDVKCSDVEWTDVIYVKWFYFELKWSGVKWSELRRSSWGQNTTHIRVTLYWGYLIVLWLFYLACVLYCGCFNLFCNMWVCVGVWFVMCGCFDNCVGGLIIRVLIFSVFLYCFVYMYVFLFVISVRTTATEWKLNCCK